MFDGITTVLPVYLRNAGTREMARLSRAVESVLAQECGAAAELLIVDDGSEPALGDLPGARMIRLPRNYGIAHALNVGLTQAKYELIARIDADDVWRPGKLAKQLTCFEADPELALVASSMRLVHGHTPQLDRDELRGGNWAETLALAERIGCPFPHGSILARRGVLAWMGGYPQAANAQHAEDFGLWAPLLRFYKVAICGEVFLEYTVSEGQISSRYMQEQQRASETPRRILAAVKDKARVPAAARKIADALQLPLLETSSILFNAWKYYEYILADDEIYDAAADLFPDRAVHRPHEAATLLADRYFYLRRGAFDPIPGARCVHTPDTI